MGTKICWSEDEIPDGFENVVGRSKALFKDSGVFMERYYPECHHIEVQVCAHAKSLGSPRLFARFSNPGVPYIGLWQW